MSVTMMSLVFGCNMPELKTDDGRTVPDTTAKFVLLALADNANEEGEGSYASVDTLCHKTNYSTSTVCNALNALRFNGFTILVGKSKWDTNNYTILAARIAAFQWPKSDDSSRRNAGVSTTETNPPHTPVNPSSEIDPIAAKLAELKFKFNPNTGVIISGWKQDFPDDVILRAIGEAIKRHAYTVEYVERILVGWKEHGVPPIQPQKGKKIKQTADDVDNMLRAWLNQGAQGVPANGD